MEVRSCRGVGSEDDEGEDIFWRGWTLRPFEMNGRSVLDVRGSQVYCLRACVGGYHLGALREVERVVRSFSRWCYEVPKTGHHGKEHHAAAQDYGLLEAQVRLS